MDFFSLTNKVVAITGASSGIGKAAAERFARAGAHVIMASRSDASEIAQGIGATFVRTDVGVESDIAELVSAVVNQFGRIDVLICNAGFVGPAGSVLEKTAADYERVFAVNTLGTMFCIKHAVPHMPRGSSVICTTSLVSIMGLPGCSDYTASKAATSGLVRAATMELGSLGIRVNEICPSATNTPMLRNNAGYEAELAITGTGAAISHLIEPEEIAALMHFLASDDCPALTGQQIAVDGGLTAGLSEGNIEAVLKVNGLM